LGRNDLVGAKGLFRVDEGSEDLARLFAFAYRQSEMEQSMAVPWRDSLFIEEGSGLLMSGMLGERDGDVYGIGGVAMSRRLRDENSTEITV
jgi:hypothetical protein